MKKITFLAVALATILLVSCKKDQPGTSGKKGYLTVNIGLSVNVTDVKGGLKSTGQTEDFKVSICYPDGTEVMSFESASVMPDTLELDPGDYFVKAWSDNDLPAAFDNPYYYGISDIFTVSSNALETVVVTCELANTIVSVVYSDTLRNSFTDFSTTVSSSAGSLIFGKDENRWGYFQPLPFDIRVELTWQNHDGSEDTKTLSGNIPDPLPKKHYEIRVNATVDNGTAMFNLVLDDTEIPVEVIEIHDGDYVQPEGAIGYGELLITEIMFDPSALTDTEGEWIEIYNPSDHDINLRDLILKRDETNVHTITDSIVLSPGAFHILQKKETSTGALNSYVYGSDITLPNTGAVVSIFNAGTEATPGPLVFSVDYGSAGFPSTSGASLCLSPSKMNAAAAVSGNSWCISTSAYSTGDLGTPGTGNDRCE